MAAVRTIICGSPQPNGKCSKLAGRLRDALQLRYPQDQVRLFCVPEINVSPCIGCNACAKTGKCFMSDDMDFIHDSMAASVELYVVSPIYFAGVPSQMKAVLDRMQPLFFTRDASKSKRKASLVLVGSGGDPHGFDPAVVITRSALAVAGFGLSKVAACIGESLDESMSRMDDLLDGEQPAGQSQSASETNLPFEGAN